MPGKRFARWTALVGGLLTLAGCKSYCEQHYPCPQQACCPQQGCQPCCSPVPAASGFAPVPAPAPTGYAPAPVAVPTQTYARPNCSCQCTQ
jgi:hypothetical protein